MPSFRGSSQPRDMNLCLLHWQMDSLPLSHLGSPFIGYYNSKQKGNAKKKMINWFNVSCLLHSLGNWKKVDGSSQGVKDEAWKPKYLITQLYKPLFEIGLLNHLQASILIKELMRKKKQESWNRNLVHPN